MNILVIPEDFRKDQYILKPLVSRLFRHLGAPNPRVEVCRDPLLGGIGEALKTAQLAEIVNDQRGMTDIFILCVDRDGSTGAAKGSMNLNRCSGRHSSPRMPGKR